MFVTTIYPHLYGQVGETFAFTTDIAHRFVYGEIFEDFFPDETKIRQIGRATSKIGLLLTVI